MLLSIFSTLYELIIGENTDYPEYQAGIFDSVGLITLVVAIVICLLFYVALGRWKAIWYSLVHWAITVVLVAAICFGFAFAHAKDVIGSYDTYLITFSLINALFAVVYFIALSFLFKRFSIFSINTPF